MKCHTAKSLPPLSPFPANTAQRLEWPPAPLVTCAVFIKRTLAPRKRVLERVEEVPEHPGYDGVVEEAYAEWHNQGGYSCKQGENPFKLRVFLSGMRWGECYQQLLASYLLPPVKAKWLSRRQRFPSSASVLLPTPGKVEGGPQIPVQSGRGWGMHLKTREVKHLPCRQIWLADFWLNSGYRRPFPNKVFWSC